MSVPDLAVFAAALRSHIETGMGARVGEAAAVSRRVHVIRASDPDQVEIRCCADAGEVFYGRRVRDGILHIDVFHSLGDVDHVSAAIALRNAVDEWNRVCRNYGGQPVMADAIDVQTATGGGRVTGSLCYGGKQSLRTAHRGHVHTAALLNPENAGFVYLAVRNVERAISSSGLELRKVARLRNVHSESGSPIDLAPYTSPTDSFLREDGSDQPRGNEDLAQQALDAASDFGSVQSLRSFLDSLGSSARKESPYTLLDREFGDSEAILARLRAMDLVRGEGASLKVTEQGAQLAEFMRKAARELEMRMRQAIRRTAGPSRLPLDRFDYSRGRASQSGRTRRNKCLPRDQVSGGSISVPDTVYRWASRSVKSGVFGPFKPDDLRLELPREKRRMDICLLVDASASMAGRRIQAAKHLARHVFYACRDRVSVLTFQDRDAIVHVVGARSARALEGGLATVRPAGLTPMAAGIEEAVNLLARSGGGHTMLVMLTDGIPTMNRYTGDPARDALTAAARIRECGIPFTCIGLSPNRAFLRRLVEEARGTLYIVEEFDRNLLSKLVSDERSRLKTW